jgi:hypothetical protein
MRVEVRDGQLALVESSGPRVLRYVAVLYEGTQYPIVSATWAEDESLFLILEGRTGRFRVRPPDLLQGFQDASEVLGGLEYVPG